MAHTKNIKDFVQAAAACESPLLKAYCGLVAIELVLKNAIGLSNHDVPSGLTRLNNSAPRSGGHSLLSLADQLRGDIDMIQVTGKDGERRTTPRDSYPFIRYATFEEDGWGEPVTSEANLIALAATVARIRNYLKTHYGYQL